MKNKPEAPKPTPRVVDEDLLCLGLKRVPGRGFVGVVFRLEDGVRKDEQVVAGPDTARVVVVQQLLVEYVKRFMTAPRTPSA